MGKLIVLLVLLGGGGAAVYYFVIQKKTINDVKDTIDEFSGYPDAKTAQEAVDLYAKAIKNRKYDTAAKYCTNDYGEQLRRGAIAAKELGTSIDDLRSRLNDSGVMHSEMDVVLYWIDPLPPSVKITLGKSKENEAIALIGVADIPEPKSQPTGSWNYDPLFLKGLYFGMPPFVKVVKQGEVWKLDFPVTPDLRIHVDRLNDRYKDYKRNLDKLSGEVKTEATTKGETKKRMQELVNEAVTATK